MYEYFGGVAKILVPDNCKTAVTRTDSWNNQQINAVYRELAEWKQATVQFNYHISVDGMLYSVPYEYIKRKVDMRITDTTIEVFYNNNRICSHRCLCGRKGQYSTTMEHIPEDHQEYIEWNGDRFRNLAERIGHSTYQVVDAILTFKQVEQQKWQQAEAISTSACCHLI